MFLVVFFYYFWDSPTDSTEINNSVVSNDKNLSNGKYFGVLDTLLCLLVDNAISFDGKENHLKDFLRTDDKWYFRKDYH